MISRTLGHSRILLGQTTIQTVIEETGYEARKTSKEQTKMQRLMLKGPRPCIIFCFAFIHYAWITMITNTFLSVSSTVRSKQRLCFVHGQEQKSEQKHTTKNFVGFHNHSPLLTMVKLFLTQSVHRPCILSYVLPGCKQTYQTLRILKSPNSKGWPWEKKRLWTDCLCVAASDLDHMRIRLLLQNCEENCDNAMISIWEWNVIILNRVRVKLNMRVQYRKSTVLSGKAALASVVF